MVRLKVLRRVSFRVFMLILLILLNFLSESNSNLIWFLSLLTLLILINFLHESILNWILQWAWSISWCLWFAYWICILIQLFPKSLWDWVIPRQIIADMVIFVCRSDSIITRSIMFGRGFSVIDLLLFHK